MSDWEPRLVSESGAMKMGWMHRESKVPLLSSFKVYNRKNRSENYNDFSNRFKSITPFLGGKYSLILFESKKEFERGCGTHSKNNFLATRPGIYAFSYGDEEQSRLYVGEGKDLFVRIKKHLSDKKIEDLSMGFCLICTDEKLYRGEDPLLSEGLRGTIETELKWLFHAWKNYTINPPYNSGVTQIISKVTASQTPRSDGHYIISHNEADLALEIIECVHSIMRNLPKYSKYPVLYNMCTYRLNLNHKNLPDLSDILVSF